MGYQKTKWKFIDTYIRYWYPLKNITYAYVLAANREKLDLVFFLLCKT